jgi:adenosylcobinamide kinase/adenosylcobinamide-phosphate guanylyltransferase
MENVDYQAFGPDGRPRHCLVIGGAASGKSALAERLVRSTGLRKHYLATARLHDREMELRAERHRKERGSDWETTEEATDLGPVIQRLESRDVLLVDCATLWLTNLLLGDHDIASEEARLISFLRSARAPVFIVSNEVGHGIVPENALARRFRDAQGRLNQRLAAEVSCVIGVMAGLPIALKGPLPAGLGPADGAAGV